MRLSASDWSLGPRFVNSLSVDLVVTFRWSVSAQSGSVEQPCTVARARRGTLRFQVLIESRALNEMVELASHSMSLRILCIPEFTRSIVYGLLGGGGGVRRIHPGPKAPNDYVFEVVGIREVPPFRLYLVLAHYLSLHPPPRIQ